MKSTLLRTFFEWALITSVLMSVGFFAWFWQKSRDLRACNSQLANAQSQFQNNRALMGMLLGECQEYGKTNADMARFLTPGVAQPPAAPAAPATKPKTK
jgi:hypothetical protein